MHLFACWPWSTRVAYLWIFLTLSHISGGVPDIPSSTLQYTNDSGYSSLIFTFSKYSKPWLPGSRTFTHLIFNPESETPNTKTAESMQSMKSYILQPPPPPHLKKKKRRIYYISLNVVSLIITNTVTLDDGHARLGMVAWLKSGVPGWGWWPPSFRKKTPTTDNKKATPEQAHCVSHYAFSTPEQAHCVSHYAFSTPEQAHCVCHYAFSTPRQAHCVCHYAFSN